MALPKRLAKFNLVVTNRVLGPLARQGLKEAFRMIERGQLILETGLAKRR